MLVCALCRIPARSCSSVARGRARRACGACAGAGLQCRAVISGLAGHARRCLTVLTMAGTCPPMASGDWTPSYCKTTVGGGNATRSTTAGADVMWKTQFDSIKEDFKDVPAAYAADTFCGKDKVKTGAGEDWLCAYAKFAATVSNQCGKDTDCSKGGIGPACESYTAMMSAVCSLTADEIKTKVDKSRTDGNCADKKDGGGEFSPPSADTTAAVVVTTPAPAAASGSSPMWALALAACLFAGVPAVSRSV